MTSWTSKKIASLLFFIYALSFNLSFIRGITFTDAEVSPVFSAYSHVYIGLYTSWIWTFDRVSIS